MEAFILRSVKDGINFRRTYELRGQMGWSSATTCEGGLYEGCVWGMFESGEGGDVTLVRYLSRRDISHAMCVKVVRRNSE